MSRYLLASLALLAGCSFPPPESLPDQCLRREIFQQCMQSLPAGPQATHYNDWDEVVAECEKTAYYQSLRRVESIKKEYRP